MTLPSLTQVASEVERLQLVLNDPATRQKPAYLKEVARDYTQQQKLLEALQRHAQLEQELREAASLTGPEMAELAAEETARLTPLVQAAQQEIEVLLLPVDERDSKDVILEMRAGAGGEEAALFVSELFRAYSRYAEQKGWKMHTVSSSISEQNGLKEVIAELTGSNVFSYMKYERGVHRVQRIPATEKQGRIHTSTITVAVLPQAEDMDIEIKNEDLRIDTYRASGAGGQHVNKTSSAVRITHIPTNTVVAVQDERSQHKNREKAFRILRSRLLAAREEARHQHETAERRQQIGTGDRSEKIRTYNIPQDRITDHRIKQSWSNIPGVMEGNFDDIITSLQAADRALKLGT